MTVGGMYEVLKIVNKFLEETPGKEVTAKEIEAIVGLSTQAVTNNMSRLVKAGFLEKREFRDPHRRGRNVKYSIRGDVIGWIRNNL